MVDNIYLVFISFIARPILAELCSIHLILQYQKIRRGLFLPSPSCWCYLTSYCIILLICRNTAPRHSGKYVILYWGIECSLIVEKKKMVSVSLILIDLFQYTVWISGQWSIYLVWNKAIGWGILISVIKSLMFGLIHSWLSSTQNLPIISL